MAVVPVTTTVLVVPGQLTGSEKMIWPIARRLMIEASYW